MELSLVTNRGDQTRYAVSLKHYKKMSGISSLAPLGSTALSFCTSFKRGFHHVEQLSPCSEFPFGIFCAWKPQKCPLDFFIAPLRLNKTHLELSDFEYPKEKTTGENKESFIPGREEFTGHREYIEGDALADIDWKKSYQDKVFVKTYEENATKSYLIDEESIKQKTATKEESIQTMSYFVDLCNRKKYFYAIKIDGLTSPFGTGRRHWEKIMEQLCEKGQE